MARGTRGCRLDDEEGAVSEKRCGCVKCVVGVDESPNPLERVTVRPQQIVGLLTSELNEFLHATFVEKQHHARLNLQDGGKFEPKPLDESTQQKDRFS